MNLLKDRIQRYFSHWTARPSPPPSIRLLEALFARISKHSWRPDGTTTHYVDHRLITHSRATYEELIPDYKGDDTPTSETPVSSDALFEAQETEIRHRVYRAIYWGNLFDHIFPIETRYYNLSTDRLLKLFFIVVVTSLVYLGATILPSWLSGKLDRTTALESTTNSVQMDFLEGTGWKEKFFSATGSTEPTLSNNTLTEGDIIQLKFALQVEVEKADLDISGWVADIGWVHASEVARNSALVDKMFFETINSDSGIGQQVLFDKKIVVTPWSNIREVLSQILILSFTILMISWFLAKKKHFCDIIWQLHEDRRIPATQLLEETLVSNFYLRKKFHYLVAFSAAVIAISVHFYAMQTTSLNDAYSLSLALGLSIHDYRIAASSQWMMLVYWAAQFFLVYFFTLVAWELGALNSCMKQWQGKLVKAGVLEGTDFNNLFTNTKTIQTPVRLFILVVFVVMLFVSWGKLIDSGVSFDYTWSGYTLDTVLSVATWSNANIAYMFSPAFLFVIVAFFATQPCFDNEDDAKGYVEKRLPDIELMVKSARQSWTQLEVAAKWLNGNIPGGQATPTSDNLEREGDSP